MQDKLLQHSSRFQIVRNETGSAYHSDCYNCVRCHISLLGKPAYSMEDGVGLQRWRNVFVWKKYFQGGLCNLQRWPGWRKSPKADSDWEGKSNWNMMTFLGKLNILFTISHQIHTKTNQVCDKNITFALCSIDMKVLPFAQEVSTASTSPPHLTDHMFVQIVMAWKLIHIMWCVGTRGSAY